MKNVFLSVVIICALAIAGVGGTLANFSDTEEVIGNTFETGSLDLLVWDGANWVDDYPWGPGADGVIDITCAAPEEVNCDVVYVANFGDCVSGDLWMRFKDCTCYNVNPSHPESGYWYYDSYLGDTRWKTEPELVAEYGGLVDQVWVEWGPLGDNCSMFSNVLAQVWFDDTLAQDWTLLCNLDDYFELGYLPSCGEEHIVTICIKYHDITDVGFTDRGGDEMFEDWPTNALQLDGLDFSFIFGLVQEDKVFEP